MLQSSIPELKVSRLPTLHYRLYQNQINQITLSGIFRPSTTRTPSNEHRFTSSLSIVYSCGVV